MATGQSKSISRVAQRWSQISHYFDLKVQHESSLLLVRAEGDFYEAFGDDARVIANVLDLTHNTATCSDGEVVEMAGIPAYAIDRYVEKLRESYNVTAIDETS